MSYQHVATPSRICGECYRSMKFPKLWKPTNALGKWTCASCGQEFEAVQGQPGPYAVGVKKREAKG